MKIYSTLGSEQKRNLANKALFIFLKKYGYVTIPISLNVSDFAFLTP